MPSPNGVVLRTKQHQLRHSGFNLWWSLSSRMDTSVTSWCSREKSGTPGRNDETTLNSLTTSSLWFKVSINFFCNNLCGSCKIRWNLLNATKCCCLWGKQYKDFSLHLALIQFICFCFKVLIVQCVAPHTFVAIPKCSRFPPQSETHPSDLWLAHYRGGPHMRSLISIEFPVPEMEPESAHVASAVSVPYLQCGDCNPAPPRQHSPIRRYSGYSATPWYVLIQLPNVIDTISKRWRSTEEARTCEAWFQLTFRPQKWNLKAHMWHQLSPFPSSNAAIAMQHHPGNIHQSVATPATPLLRGMS